MKKDSFNFYELRDEAVKTLPPLGKKAMRHCYARLNVAIPQLFPFAHRPDLLPRYMRVMELRNARLVRHFDPNDPNRLPK